MRVVLDVSNDTVAAVWNDRPQPDVRMVLAYQVHNDDMAGIVDPSSIDIEKLDIIHRVDPAKRKNSLLGQNDR